jgi:hypothetical protein
LANRWFDAALPANKLYLGTFHAVDPSGDAAEAKRLWDEATRGGASAEELYPLLVLKPRPVKANNTPEQQAGIPAVPDNKRVLEARKAIRAKFQKEIAAADSPDAKVELAAKLAEAGAASQDPVERYTLLREACEFSAGRGDLIDIEVTVNQLADHFKVDKLTVELEALKKASDSPDRNVAKTAAESGMQLASRVTDAKRADLAKRLGAMVVVAARKSGDKLLVEQAQQTKKQLDQIKPVKATR